MIGNQIGKYRIVSEIGRGGMGVVYRAVQTTLNRTVCIKVLSPHLAGSGEYLARFEREAESLARVAHENIVHIYDVETFEGRQCIVMEYVGGPSLTQLLAQRRRLTPAHTRDVSYALAGALAVAHRKGIVHRDIKPDNILFSLDGRPKLTDFGIARMRDSKVKTQTGLMLGTPYYMSPEQARGQTVTAVSDIYSLGVVMYEMLSGRLPFLADDALAVALQHIQAVPPRLEDAAPDVPRQLARIVHRALEKDPARRHASMDEFRAALTAVELGMPIGAALAREAAAPALAHAGPVCPECHAPIQSDFLTCPSCGLSIQQQCLHCGKLYDPLGESCPSCRTPSTPAPAPLAPAPVMEPVPVAPVAGAGVPGGIAPAGDTLAAGVSPAHPADRLRQVAAGVAGEAGAALRDAGSVLVDAAARVPLPSQTLIGRVWDSTRRRLGLPSFRRHAALWSGAAVLLLGGIVAAAMQLTPDGVRTERADSTGTGAGGGGTPMWQVPAGGRSGDGGGGRQSATLTEDQLTALDQVAGEEEQPPPEQPTPVDSAQGTMVAPPPDRTQQPPEPVTPPTESSKVEDVKSEAGSAEAAARSAIEAVIERQRRATETGDVELFLRDLDEDLGDEELEDFQLVVRTWRNRTSRVSNIRIEFDDDETAVVRFHARMTGVRVSTGRSEQLWNQEVEWLMERRGARWLIVETS